MNQPHLIANICQYTSSQDLLAFSWAIIQLGHSRLILPQFDRNKMRRLLEKACIMGGWQFELLKYIQYHENAVYRLTADDARTDYNYALRGACYNGYIKVCQWLHQTFKLTVEDARSCNDYALQWACHNGHIEVCQWLYQTFKLTVEDARSLYNYALRWARSNGHTHIIDWLYQTYGIQ